MKDDNTECSKRYLLYALPPSHPAGKHFLRTPSVSITPVTLKENSEYKYCKKGMCKNERHLFPCYISKVITINNNISAQKKMLYVLLQNCKWQNNGIFSSLCSVCDEVSKIRTFRQISKIVKLTSGIMCSERLRQRKV